MLRLLLGMIVLLAGFCAASPAVEAYYRGAAAGDHPHLATNLNYCRVYRAIKAHYVQPVSDEELAHHVRDEIVIMVRALGENVTELDGLPVDLNFPRYAIRRLEGRVSPGMVWLAACHGLASIDTDAQFRSIDERTGSLLMVPASGGGATCVEDLHTTPRHPPYARHVAQIDR